MWNEYFYYRRGERIAVLILLIALVVGVGISFLMPPANSSLYATLQSDSSFMHACDSFFSTVAREKRQRPAFAQPPAPVLTAFDPNTADSAALVKLGLPGWVARNILKYRSKGGRFYHPEQFARIYGIDSLLFRQLLPFIRIDTTRLAKPRLQYERDTLSKRFPEKFTELTPIELNSADTSLLKKIPGIGSGFAAMVVGYRRQLGGFYRVAQLKELRGVTDSLFHQWEPWFYVDLSLVEPIDVNKAGITRLRNHPYLNFYQAKVIVETRRQYQRLGGWGDLVLLEEFSPDDVERLKPYLHFSEK